MTAQEMQPPIVSPISRIYTEENRKKQERLMKEKSKKLSLCKGRLCVGSLVDSSAAVETHMGMN